MANRSFQLKRSRLAIVFQLTVFILLILLLQQTLQIWLCLFALLLAFLIYIRSFKLPQVLHFEHLDALEWSLLYTKSNCFQRVVIDYIVDHELYIVVYFQNTEHKFLVIWRDQLCQAQWKNLKKLAQLY